VRCAEPGRGSAWRARLWLLAGCAACLLACTGPGLEPPGADGASLPPGVGGPAGGDADNADGGAPAVEPPVGGGNPNEGTPPANDAGVSGDADGGDDADLDGGAP